MLDQYALHSSVALGYVGTTKFLLPVWYQDEITMSRSASVAGPSRVAFALWLDVLLLVLLLVVQSPRFTGVAAHEVIGIAIAIPLLIHMLLSWHWIVSKGRRLFTNGSVRTRINYLINVALFVAMATVIVTGIVVSRVVLPAAGIGTVFDGDWFEVHDASSNVLFFAVGLHLAMNWGWVLAAFRKRAFSNEEAEANESEATGG